MRSWKLASSVLGAQVTIVHDSTRASRGPQRSHRPAKANGAPSPTVKRYGVRAFFGPVYSKKPSAKIAQRRLCRAPRKTGFSASVSTRALMSF